MKKIMLLVLSTLLFMGFWMSVFSSPVQAFSGGGSGVSGDPYVVLTADDLNRVREDLDAHYIQGADIDLSDYALDLGWEPIGTSGTPFKGTFDGNHYRITGLVINSAASANIGLFGNTSQSTIQNVGLENIDIKSSASTVDDVGGLVGRGSGTFTNNYTSGNLVITVPSHNSNNSSRVGGLIGSLYDDGSQISNSYSTVHLSTNVQHVGGLVGLLDQNTLIKNSYATGNVSGYLLVGGLTGVGYNIREFSNSYAAGDVKVEFSGAGGLFGHMQIPVYYSFAAGKVSGENEMGEMGAFAGQSYGSVSSYWNETANPFLSASPPGWNMDPSVGLTEDKMKQQESFVGFDFAETWGINQGHSYPYLRVFAPVVQVDDLLPTPYRQGSTLTVTGEMRDGSIGQAVTVHYEIFDSLDQPIGVGGSENFAAATGGYEPYSFSVVLDETNFPGGNYTVNVIAEDSASEVSHERSVAFSVPSSNADLSNLTVSPGILSPTFAPNIDSYTVSVDNTVSSLDVTTIPSDSNATVTVNGNATTSDTITLTGQPTTITIVVTAQDGEEKTYTLMVQHADIPVTSVTLNLPTLNLTAGESSAALSATLNPSNATNQNVTWSSDNPAVVSVDGNGVVTPNSAGTATITVTTVDGGKTAISLVMVQKNPSGGGGGTIPTPVPTPTNTLTFDTNGGSAVTTQNITYNEAALNTAVPTKEGYTFAGWYKEADFITKWDFATDVVKGNTTLYAKWTVNLPSCTASFTDTATHWASEEIGEIACREIIKGYIDGTFKPNNSIIREHVALMFTRAFELTPIRDAISFADVPISHINYDAIIQVYQAGIFDGESNEKFKPNAQMTRAQMAKVLVLAFDLQPSETSTNGFQDVPSTHWAKDYIATLADNGIAFGDNGGFKPEEPVTRAQFVAFMYRALNL